MVSRGNTGQCLQVGRLAYGSDGSNEYPILVDSSGRIILGAGTNAIGKLAANSGVDIGDVDILSIAAGTNVIGKLRLVTALGDEITDDTSDAVKALLVAGTSRIGKVQPDMHEVRVVKAIDASIEAYTAGDMVNDDDCCTTAAAWEIAGAASATGGYGAIWGIDLVNETENQAVQYEIILFNATPAFTGVQFTDNWPNVHPHKEDRSKHIRDILLPTSIARGAAIATTTHASPSTSGGLPVFYKCATGSTSLYFVLVTRTAYTQTATDDIEITFNIEHQ